ncbi:hypothetical protein [Candidatus Nitrotoga fabula]|uniref:Uncharacterized protein n=1 Tax=Candidatus Nitrotoga fabula TaxID=2182327 RepID=A0A916BGT3_9PROT|nr:hypothetical protein [Candidatus Nitrotoga fabula]CAE6723369.1 hypothetical protein NTGZN8_330013 [Candidatus Nitrotoga fabula]
MYKYIKNENKSHDVFRINIISYMLNCHADGKSILAVDMKTFSTAKEKHRYKSNQLCRVASDLIERGLIKRIYQGRYEVVNESALKKELQNDLMFNGFFGEEKESNQDLLLDILYPCPSEKTFRINVLRHIVNLHIQNLPIRAVELKRFSTYKKQDGGYRGVSRIFKVLLDFCAIKRSVIYGGRHLYYVTDLAFIKEMLCDLEQSNGFPVSYPGLKRKIKIIEQAEMPLKTGKVKVKPKKESPSPWFKPPPAWLGALDAVMGNLGR